MRAIKGRDTLPEVIVRKWLFARGYRFRCQYGKVPGHPDVALPRIRTLIEIRGCFWHRHGWIPAGKGRGLIEKEHCRAATMPKTNRAFWQNKFRTNVERDTRHEKEWTELGWNVIVIWECGLKTAEDRERTFGKVGRWLAEFEAALSR